MHRFSLSFLSAFCFSWGFDVVNLVFVVVSDPTKFFGTELGSQSRYDAKEDRAVVNGAHDPLKLAELLNKFIELFILCPNCKCVFFTCISDCTFGDSVVTLID
jgi:hypothetical protein